MNDWGDRSHDLTSQQALRALAGEPRITSTAHKKKPKATRAFGGVVMTTARR